MKGKINKHGIIEFLRGKKWVEQNCPFQEDVFCGDLCVLFSEPKKQSVYVELSLCKKVYLLSGFKDERE